MGGLVERQAGVEEELRFFLAKAKNGDLEARETLIKKYTPFILKTVSKTCGRYIYLGQDDEASIGLLAFDEAINSFNAESHNYFLSFAELVIKRRLIDYFRKEKRDEKIHLLVNYRETEEGDANSAEWLLDGKVAFDNYSKEEEAKSRRDEILQYNQILKQFGLSFKEIVEVSPKHQDARVSAIKVAKLIAENPDLKKRVLEKKVLPLKEIEDLVDVSRKTLERNRKYIIAVFLIFVLDFTYLREYLKEV